MKTKRSNLRKYLFYGLTVILVSAFIFLALQSHRLEKEQMQQGNEIVQSFKPTPIRVLAPGDLEILDASMTLEAGIEAGNLSVARHNIEIYNSGNVSYCEVQLRLDYLDARGNVIESLPYEVKNSIPPGETLVLNDFLIPDIPNASVECRPFIVYADFEPVGSAQEE